MVGIRFLQIPFPDGFIHGIALDAGDKELLVHTLLKRKEIAKKEFRLIYTACFRAFQRFSFDSSLYIGLKLIKWVSLANNMEKARLHHIIGLSAHNRQFQTKGNIKLARFLSYHFQESLKYEIDHELRACLNYRLAVTYGRRMKEVDKGIMFSKQIAIELKKENTKKHYYIAWGKNINAYLFMLKKNIIKAKEECFEGYNLVSESSKKYNDFLDRDLIATQALIAYNLSHLFT